MKNKRNKRKGERSICRVQVRGNMVRVRIKKKVCVRVKVSLRKSKLERVRVSLRKNKSVGESEREKGFM